MKNNFFEQSTGKNNSEKRLIRVLLRKMEEEKLTDKEKQMIAELKSRYNPGKMRNKISNAQLNRAAKRNRQALQQKMMMLPDSNRKRRTLHGHQLIGTVAAVAVVLLLFTLWRSDVFTQHSDDHEIVMNNGINKQFTTDDRMKRITLADGSTIYLNRASSLSLRRGKFNAYSREVWLDEGEAFFSITKDAQRPFVVHSSNGVTTRVLGTSFNIKSYSALPDQVITVNTGRVQVFNSRQEEIILEPNYKVSISTDDGTLSAGMTDAQSVSSWRSGKIILENATLLETSFRLKQYYDVDLIYDEATFSNDLIYTILNPGTPLDEVLTVIGKLFDASCEKEGSKVYMTRITE